MRKQRNPHKVNQFVARKILNNYLIFYLGGHDKNKCEVWDKRINKALNGVPWDIAQAFEKLAFNWSVTIFVLYRTQNKSEYMKLQSYKFHELIKQSEFTEFMNKAHNELINQGNSLHLCNVGWVATPSEEPSDDYICNIVNNFKGWDYPTKWENDNEYSKSRNDSSKSL